MSVSAVTPQSLGRSEHSTVDVQRGGHGGLEVSIVLGSPTRSKMERVEVRSGCGRWWVGLKRMC